VSTIRGYSWGFACPTDWDRTSAKSMMVAIDSFQLVQRLFSPLWLVKASEVRVDWDEGIALVVKRGKVFFPPPLPSYTLSECSTQGSWPRRGYLWSYFNPIMISFSYYFSLSSISCRWANSGNDSAARVFLVGVVLCLSVSRALISSQCGVQFGS